MSALIDRVCPNIEILLSAHIHKNHIKYLKINMKSRLTLSLIGCTLLTLLSPNITHAQYGDFGTNRQPRTCSSTSEPKTGRMSAAQAMTYVACQAEGDLQFKVMGALHFIDILSFQVDPKPRQVTFSDIQAYAYSDMIDEEKPIYILTGSVVSYTCFPIGSGPRGQNCFVRRVPQSSGRCYKSRSRGWRCSMSTYSRKEEHKMPPPD